MLERKEWNAFDVREEETAIDYIGRILSLPKRVCNIIVKYHLAGVNNRMVLKDTPVHDGDFISVTLPDEKPEKTLPEDMELDILYEDDALLVLNKPRGTAVIPGPENWHKTMISGLLHYLGEDRYCTFVHRIDRTSSGCLLAAKSRKSAALLCEQIAGKSAHRIYRALCTGVMPERGSIHAPIGRDPENFRRMAVCGYDAKHAVTHYDCLLKKDTFTEARFFLETGRTHQIRVHAAYIGHPLIGDDLYGSACRALADQGAVLHAERLIFTHPFSKEVMEVQAPLPAYYTDLKTAFLMREESRNQKG